MSRRLLALNLVLLAVIAVSGYWIARELTTPRSVPQAAAPKPGAQPAAAGAADAPVERASPRAAPALQRDRGEEPLQRHAHREHGAGRGGRHAAAQALPARRHRGRDQEPCLHRGRDGQEHVRLRGGRCRRRRPARGGPRGSRGDRAARGADGSDAARPVEAAARARRRNAGRAGCPGGSHAARGSRRGPAGHAARLRCRPRRPLRSRASSRPRPRRPCRRPRPAPPCRPGRACCGPTSSVRPRARCPRWTPRRARTGSARSCSRARVWSLPRSRWRSPAARPRRSPRPRPSRPRPRWSRCSRRPCAAVPPLPSRRRRSPCPRPSRRLRLPLSHRRRPP